MKIFSIAALVVALLASSYSAELTTVQNADSSVSCTLSGPYENATNVTSCSTLEISSLTVPAGQTLDLRKVKTGAKITFTGNITLGILDCLSTAENYVVELTLTALIALGWPARLPVRKEPGRFRRWRLGRPGRLVLGQNVTRPVFFRMWKEINSTVSSSTSSTRHTLEHTSFKIPILREPVQFD